MVPAVARAHWNVTDGSWRQRVRQGEVTQTVTTFTGSGLVSQKLIGFPP